MPKIFKSKLILIPTAVVIFSAVIAFIYLPVRFGWPASAYTSSSSGNSRLTCFITDSACSGTVIFKMYDYASGGHAGSSGSYQVCCTGAGLSNSSSGTAVLRMSAADNAHVQETGSYAVPAYLSSSSGTVSCTYPTSACPSGYACLATLSAADNAHVAGCDSSPYSVRVCCKVQLTVSACTAKVASDKSISLANTNIQLCSGADVTDPSDHCYSVCWKGSGTPDLTSSYWKCAVCHDDDNNPISCSTQTGTTFAWSMPSGYSSPANYSLVSGTLTSPNPVVKFTTANSSRKITLAIAPVNSSSCSAQNTTLLLPTWTEISPF